MHLNTFRPLNLMVALRLHLALTCDHHDPIKQIGSSVNQNTARLHLATSVDFSITDIIQQPVGSVFPAQYLNMSADNCPGAKSTWSGGFSLEKHFQSWDNLKSNISVEVSLGCPPSFFSESLWERGWGFALCPPANAIKMCPQLPLDQDKLIG